MSDSSRARDERWLQRRYADVAYRDWIQHPEAFDDLGFPLHRDGASTTVAGLYFVGVHFLRKRKSSLLVGVGEDAGLVAEQIAG